MNRKDKKDITEYFPGISHGLILYNCSTAKISKHLQAEQIKTNQRHSNFQNISLLSQPQNKY